MEKQLLDLVLPNVTIGFCIAAFVFGLLIGGAIARYLAAKIIEEYRKEIDAQATRHQQRLALTRHPANKAHVMDSAHSKVVVFEKALSGEWALPDRDSGRGHPYSADEQQVVAYLKEIMPDIGAGAGADPIGFLIASHRMLVHGKRSDEHSRL